MGTSIDIHLGLDDLLADLHHARRNEELGRLALLAYCEIRTWARHAGMPYIAQTAAQMFTQSPCVCKQEFLEQIDQLIAILENHLRSYQKARVQHVHYVQPTGDGVAPLLTQ